jgi:hypothetical protein
MLELGVSSLELRKTKLWLLLLDYVTSISAQAFMS